MGTRLRGSRRPPGGRKKHLLKFDASLTTFTPSMAVRAGTVFAGAPIVQGKISGEDVPDNLTFVRGNLAGVVASLFYDRFDPNQGTFVFRWTPETDRTAGRIIDEYLWYVSADYSARYVHDLQRLAIVCGGQQFYYSGLATVAGDTYCLIVSWDCKKTIDGVNYGRASLNDVHDYGITTQPTASAPNTTMYIGSAGAASSPANALIEGLFYFRRVFWDGLYGTDINGGIDEIALISAGADPCAIAGGGGSWDCTFGLPTDSTPAALVTGEGHAWSHPHDSEIELDAFLDDEFAGGNWVVEGTPLTPQEISFDGAATSVVVADAAAIQDLHAGEFTAEAWISPDDWGSFSGGRIFDKADSAAEGWSFAVNGTYGLYVNVQCVTTPAISRVTLAQFVPDGRWHHVAEQFDGTALPAGNPQIYLWIDGIPVTYSLQQAGVGAAVTDVGNDLYIGARSDATRIFDGRLGGWARLSNTLRYTPGKAFVPNSRMNPPGVDGNTAWQTDYSDGAGAALTDDSGNGNNGVITDGAGGWLVTHDMALDAPGARMYHGGYVFGNDVVDKGFKQIIAGLAAGSNYVFRIPVHWGADSQGGPRIVVYDETNGAAISTFLGPLLAGVHTGGNNLATLIAATGNFPQSLIGMTLYNITDGSSTTVTAVSGDMTTVTAVLAGGTDNDWDTGDVYRFVWSDGFANHPWCEWFSLELPTMARNGVVADCVSASVQCLNATSVGTMYWHQVEWLANLFDNPGLETFTGANPDIPDGWTNSNLDAGDSEEENTVVHSGVASLQYNAGAISSEGIYYGITAASGDFVDIGAYVYGSGAAGITLTEWGIDETVYQSTLATVIDEQRDEAAWQPLRIVARITGASPEPELTGDGAGPIYADDIYAVALNAVSLTATPRSRDNSLELGGLSIDGRDTCTQPSGRLTRTHGTIRFSADGRHAMGDIGDWGSTYEYLVDLFIDANNRLLLRRENTPRLFFSVESNGATLTDNWNTAWAAAVVWGGIIRWNPARVWVLVQGVEVLTVAWVSVFTADPATVYFGSDYLGANQFDGVILP